MPGPVGGPHATVRPGTFLWSRSLGAGIPGADPFGAARLLRPVRCAASGASLTAPVGLQHFLAHGPVNLARTCESLSIDLRTSVWSSARWRTMTSVQPDSPSAAKLAATRAGPPVTGADGSKPR
jgi:hypothetical protein